MNGNKLKKIVTEKKVWVGTHNSMSYLPVKQWWKKPFRIFAKCQELSIQEQIEKYDVIDLRVCVGEKLSWEFAHGFVDFKEFDIHHILHLCNISDKPKIVRLILEKITKDRFEDCDDFITLCKYCEKTYPNVIFIGGNRKFDWYKVFDFNANKYFPDNVIYQHVSSMADDAKWYEKILPKVYAYRHNVNPEIHKEFKEGINLYDFVK